LSKVFTVERHQVKGERHCALIVHPAMQRVEIRRTVWADPDDLSIKDCGAIDPGNGLSDQRVTLRPVCPMDRVEPHPAISDHGSAAGSRLVSAHAPTLGCLATIGWHGWMKAAGAMACRESYAGT
jgi:hypothetical protein